jgi:hypothetical protein
MTIALASAKQLRVVPHLGTFLLSNRPVPKLLASQIVPGALEHFAWNNLD